MWFPLESNPAVMNAYLVSLGFPDTKAAFMDVYGTSEDLLCMVPTPVYAVMLVYPICKATEDRTAELQKAQKEEIVELRRQHPFFFTHQLVDNACGTIAIVHAAMNNLAHLGTRSSGSAMDLLCTAVTGLTDPARIGKIVSESAALRTAHAAAAEEGATENQPLDTPINLHFVCFAAVGGRVVELDGRKPNPTLHGVCEDSASFLKAAAVAIEEKMKLNPDSYEFGITALVEKTE